MSALAVASVTKCCVAMGLPPEDVRSNSRSPSMILARRVICHVMHNVYGFSFPEIYRGFHGRDVIGSHTGVRGMALIGCQMVEAADPAYVDKARACIDALRESVRVEGPVLPRAFNPAIAARFFVDALDGDGSWDDMPESERAQYIGAMRQTGKMLDNVERGLTGTMAKAMGITLMELLRGRRNKSSSRRRAVLAYMLRTYAGMTYQDIADHLGGIDHTSAMYAVRRVQEQLKTGDPLTVDLVSKCQPIVSGLDKAAA